MPYDHNTPEGMRAHIEESLRFFREDMTGTVAEQVPLYLHDFDFEAKTITTVLTPTPWMADRTGDMSNGAFAVALDETMGFLCLYAAGEKMTPTVTMQLSLLRPIPIDKNLYIQARLMGGDGTKIDVNALAWSEGEQYRPVCSAVGIYFAV